MENDALALLAANLTRYHLAQRSIFKNLLQTDQLPLTQYEILSILSDNQNIRMGDLSAIMTVSRPNLTPLVDRLVRDGLVSRSVDSYDRRVTYISITQQGRLVLREEQEHINLRLAEYLKTFSKKEAAALENALRTIYDIYDSHSRA